MIKKILTIVIAPALTIALGLSVSSFTEESEEAKEKEFEAICGIGPNRIIVCGVGEWTCIPSGSCNH